MIHIEIPKTITQTIDVSALEKIGWAALQHQSVPEDVELTLVLTDDEQLHTLNRDYLGKDAPTDVLSFPASETDPETGAPYIGDILVSVERADRQAVKAGHVLMDELQLLVVHGTLHLLGYDHVEAGEKARMWAAQAEILASVGLGDIRISEE